jgi:hypothetical protein
LNVIGFVTSVICVVFAFAYFWLTINGAQLEE